MQHWLSNTFLPTVIAIVVMLVVLWPTRQGGTRLLRNWGVPEPAGQQVAEAVRYLWQRRRLMVVLFVVVPTLADLVVPALADGTVIGIFVPLLAAMLIAELIATLRPVSGVRFASLGPRRWQDLVPRWGVVAFAVPAVLAVGLSWLAIAGQTWADAYAAALPPNDDQRWISADYRAEMTNDTGWFTLGSAVLCLVVVATLVHLAVRRPAVPDAAVDAALRARTARVAVAVGIGWLGVAANAAAQRIVFLTDLNVSNGQPLPERPDWLNPGLGDVMNALMLVVLAAALVCWMWLAVPSRRSLAHAG
ncbi:hypothetical protein [Actinophytocola gossypii]|uniref:Cytochrome c oxidase assembly protein n=1 Tax=Actinophytocola gossypii TaxID=2812003 RepID=A0ABT2JF11_9PSEU|nr:hypothetical protein [Actinophytocola gossypii]MCT2586461.1 hypothetical protein [Actinophytocola gossypii]